MDKVREQTKAQGSSGAGPPRGGIGVTLADTEGIFRVTLRFCLQFNISLKTINLEITGRHTMSSSPSDPFRSTAAAAALHSSPLFSPLDECVLTAF